MNACNFEFNGINANSMGYFIVSFDGAKDSEQDYGDITVYNTSKSANNPQIQIHGSHTEEPKKFHFQIAKLNCARNGRPEPILPREQAFLKRWLERKDGYKYLRFLEDECGDIYYYCTIDIKWQMINSVIYGANIYVTCDSANAYSDIKSYEIQNFQTEDTFEIFNDSDEIGQIEMIQIEITALADDTIHLSNHMDDLYSCDTSDDASDDASDMVIKDCKAEETLIINGLMNQIFTDNVEHSSTLMNDYNFNPLHLINLDDSVYDSQDIRTTSEKRTNIITNKGAPCHLSFTYRTIRSGVI